MQSKPNNPDTRRTMKLLSELPLVDLDGRYTAQDVSRDFKLTFLEETHNKRVLAKILEMAPVLGSVHVFNSPEASAYNEGRRSVVLEILSYLLFQEDIDEVVR